MLTKELNQTYGRLPEEAKQVILALSLLITRIQSLPKADQQDLFELMKEWPKADETERTNIHQTMEEILAQMPLRVQKEELPASLEPVTTGWASHVGKLIKKFRDEKGWTQAQLSEKAGLPQSHICRLERAEHSATHKTLTKLAAALGKEVSDFDPSAE